MLSYRIMAYERIGLGVRPHWWMGLVYHDGMRHQDVYAIIGIHLIWRLIYQVGWRYDRWRTRPGWTDRIIRTVRSEAYQDGREKGIQEGKWAAEREMRRKLEKAILTFERAERAIRKDFWRD